MNNHVLYFHIISEHTVHDLLEVLCSIDKTPREHLETQQACFKQFAQILDFVLRFDDTKVSKYVRERKERELSVFINL